MEVVESCILPRLPVKTLVRFKSVSKSWKTLISSSNFLHLHQRHANRLLLIPGLGHTLLQVHNLDSPFDPPSFIPYPNQQLLCRYEDRMNVFASCELFFLVGYSSSIAIDRLFLLNPSTLSYHSIIPTQRRFKNSHVQYWLYFDEANDDCKVVRMETFDLYAADDGWEVQIYSCKTNLWRLIEHKVLSEEYHYIYFRPAECVHNNLLYLISHFSDHLRIRCFDIQAEQWRNDILFPRKLRHPELCTLDGSLCVLGIDENNKEEVRTGTFCVWVLNESGAIESWVKFMSIVPESTRDPGTALSLTAKEQDTSCYVDPMVPNFFGTALNIKKLPGLNSMHLRDIIV